MMKKRGVCWIPNCSEKIYKNKSHGLCQLHLNRILLNFPVRRLCDIKGCKNEIYHGIYCIEHSPTQQRIRRFKKYAIFKYNKKIKGIGLDSYSTTIIKRHRSNVILFTLYKNEEYYLQLIHSHREEELWYKLKNNEVDKAWSDFTSGYWCNWESLLEMGGIKCDRG